MGVALIVISTQGFCNAEAEAGGTASAFGLWLAPPEEIYTNTRRLLKALRESHRCYWLLFAFGFVFFFNKHATAASWRQPA